MLKIYFNILLLGEIQSIMISFLFWNLNRNNLSTKVAYLAEYYNVDIFIFAEMATDPYEQLFILNKIENYYYSPGIGCDKIYIFSRFSDDFIRPYFETDRLTIRHLNLPGLTDILIAVNHFPSKLFWDKTSQSFECVRISDYIKDAEDKMGHSRTLFIGDLNMNPFEDGIVSAAGLHAVMSKKIAKRLKRKVQGVEYPFFYNPMWNFFGDSSPGPPGTFYYQGSEHVCFFWNMFDQLLIRPELLRFFRNDDLSILTSDGKTSLLSKEGLPLKKKNSDHLPIYFGLNL